MKNKISIIMGIYNCDKYLAESIESILNQTYDNWELIMCDDGSVDDTLKIAQTYANKFPQKIKVLINSQNMGLNYTLNRCIEHATGEYIARQDGDDISLPNRFEKEIKFLKQNPEYSLVSSNMIFFDENGDWGKSHNYGEVKKEDFIKGSPICHAPCLIKTDVLKAVGGYTVEKKLLRVEDYHLWFKLFINKYKCYSLDECLYKMRDDNDAYKRRNLKNRINETRLKLWGFKKIKIPLSKYIWAFKPIIAFLMPKNIYKKFHYSNLKYENYNCNKKIKIAQFVGSMNCGGSETMLMNLYKNFDKEKYEFTFIEDVKDECWYDENIRQLGGKIIKIEPLKISYIFKYIRNLTKIFKQEKFDAIHSHVFLHSGLVMLAAKKAKIPIRISHSHSAMNGYQENWKSKIKKFCLQKLILKYSTKLVACSKEAGLCLFGKDFEKEGTVLPNPIQLDLINSIDKNDANNELRKKYHLTKKKFVIGHVGRLVDIKNHKFLIEIAKKLVDKHFDFKMFFIGDGPEKENIKNLIISNNLEKHIVMTGIQDIESTYKHMKMFDILLLPSFYEGLPVTLVEAQASILYSIVSENVSADADLGLKLMKFESIDNADKWVKLILKFKKKDISKKKINDVINKKGYSSEKSVIEYQKLYGNETKKNKYKIETINKKDKFIIFIVPLIIATIFGILSYLFQPKSGYDLCAYYSWAGKMLSFNKNDLIGYIFHNGEFITMLYLYLIANIGNFNLLQFFPTFIIYYIIFYIIIDYAKINKISWKNIVIVSLIFLSLFKFVFAVSSFRYTLAYSIFALAIYLDLVKNKKSVLVKALYIIPVFIHISSLLLVFFRVILSIKNKLFKNIILLLILFAALFPKIPLTILESFNNIKIINYFSLKINMYLVEERIDIFLQYLFRIIQSILIVFVNFLVYFKYKTKKENEYHNFFNIIGIFTICVVMYYTMFMRLCDFLLLLSPILFFKFLDIIELFQNKIKFIVMFVIFIFIIAGIRIQIPIFKDMYFRKESGNESYNCIYPNV